MKKAFVLILSLLFVSMAFGQKVKIKNKVCYIDEQVFLTWEDKSFMIHQPSPVTHVNGEAPVFVMQMHKYGSDFYTSIRFLDFEEEFWSKDKTRKKLFSMIYKSNLFNEDGTIDEKKATRFIRTYHEEPPELLLIGNGN